MRVVISTEDDLKHKTSHGWISIFESVGGGEVPNDLLDGSVHQDTVAEAVARGKLMIGNSTPAWAGLAIDATRGSHLRSTGTDPSWENHRNTLEWVDDFINEGTETGEVGNQGWQFSGGTIETLDEVDDHPGIIRRQTNATATRTTMFLGSATNNIRSIDYDEVFDIEFMVRIDSIVDISNVEVGLTDNPGTATPSTGVFFRFDPSVDASWRAHNRTNGAEATGSPVDSTIDVVANTWYRLRIYRSGTAIKFDIDGTERASITEGAFSTGFGPYLCIARTTTTNKIMDVDYVFMRITGLTR